MKPRVEGGVIRCGNKGLYGQAEQEASSTIGTLVSENKGTKNKSIIKLIYKRRYKLMTKRIASDCKHTITFNDGSALRKSGVAKKRKKPIKPLGDRN